MLYLILLLPFLLGIGCAFCKEENARRLTPVLAAAQTVLTALVIYAAVSGKDWATNVVYLSESLTFSLKMDGVAAVFAVVTAVCWLLTIPYAAVYMPHSGGEPRFYVFLFTTEAVLLGTALAADMVTLYLFYELTTLCSAPLVLHELKKRPLSARTSTCSTRWAARSWRCSAWWCCTSTVTRCPLRRAAR